MKSIFSRLTSKDRDFPEARDSVTEMEDIKKKASSFRTSMSKPETEIRVNRNVKWINTVARCLGKFSRKNLIYRVECRICRVEFYQESGSDSQS